MQTFKEIPYQNYIELKFNSKNLNEITQQEALIKYKRNAQLLAEIFTFDNKKREVFKSQEKISQEQIDELARQIQQEQEDNKKRIESVRQNSKKYEQLNHSIKDIKSKEELFNIVDQMKKENLYDDQHPFFVANSPFYLSTTEEEYLEVTKSDDMSEEGLIFLEIN